jgi:hypothetical protein
MGTLLPGEVIIYERVDGIIYAKYRDRPEIPRWSIGRIDFPGDLTYTEWINLVELAKENTVLKAHLEKLITVYNIVKKNNGQK